jgi:hypothetical protein
MEAIFDDLSRALSQPRRDARAIVGVIALKLAGNLATGLAIGLGVAVAMAIAG